MDKEPPTKLTFVRWQSKTNAECSGVELGSKDFSRWGDLEFHEERLRNLMVHQDVVLEHYLHATELKVRIESMIGECDGHYEADAYGKVMRLIDKMIANA